MPLSSDVNVDTYYKDKIKGTVELSMVKEGGEWKIDGMGFPKFDNSI